MSELKYKTKQRDEILAFFTEHKDECFTAREICSNVSAGEATVFRTISKLTDEGKIKRFTSGSGRECAFYQFNACDHGCDHIHLKCNKCGQLIHMDCEFISEFLSHFMKEHNFAVDSGKTVIYGLCEGCGKEAKHEN